MRRVNLFNAYSQKRQLLPLQLKRGLRTSTPHPGMEWTLKPNTQMDYVDDRLPGPVLGQDVGVVLDQDSRDLH